MENKEEFIISAEESLPYVEIKHTKKETKNNKEIKKEIKKEESVLVNPLRNEKVEVRFIPKQGKITNTKHVLYGGMAESAYRIFVTPKLESGNYVNVLTDSEKEFLEDVLGLEYNALSVYKKENNFWAGDVDNPISRVKLYKYNNYLNLANPEDYIKYKILLANKNFIAPSLEALRDFPKATYQYVIVRSDEETKQAKDSMSNTMKCYKEFGKIEDDVDKLRLIIESIEGRNVSPNSKIDFLHTKINSLIQSDPKIFYTTITDPLLDTKVLIRKCVDARIIAYRGKGLYLVEDGSPLCDNNEEPTLAVAARFLNSPKRQDLLFSLQNKLNK
jgi:hypothetical protein